MEGSDRPRMDPFLKENKRQMAAGLLSAGMAVVTGALGIFNWLAMRSFLLSLLAYFRVDPFAWKGIDNFLFLLMGLGWLAYVYFSQHCLKKGILAGHGWKSLTLLLSAQLWLLAACRLIPMGLGAAPTGRADLLAASAESALAVFFTLAAALAGRRTAKTKTYGKKE